MRDIVMVACRIRDMKTCVIPIVHCGTHLSSEIRAPRGPSRSLTSDASQNSFYAFAPLQRVSRLRSQSPRWSVASAVARSALATQARPPPPETETYVADLVYQHVRSVVLDATARRRAGEGRPPRLGHLLCEDSPVGFCSQRSRAMYCPESLSAPNSMSATNPSGTPIFSEAIRVVAIC